MTKLSYLLDKLRDKKLKLVTAESCTGGMIASAITDIAGSSDVFDRGFVTYSNQSKIDMLNVSHETLEKYGAVSKETCEEMLKGALANSKADIAIAVTGVAGPSGGTKEKPVGLVYIGIANKNKIKVTKNIISGNRSQIRKSSVEKAFTLLNSFL